MELNNASYGTIEAYEDNGNIRVKCGGLEKLPPGYTLQEWSGVLKIIGELLLKQAVEYTDGKNGKVPLKKEGQ